MDVIATVLNASPSERGVISWLSRSFLPRRMVVKTFFFFGSYCWPLSNDPETTEGDGDGSFLVAAVIRMIVMDLSNFTAVKVVAVSAGGVLFPDDGISPASL